MEINEPVLVNNGRMRDALIEMETAGNVVERFIFW